MLLVFMVDPMFYNIRLSFHENAPLKRRLVYVGLDNWSALIADTRFWEALSVMFTCFSYC